MIAHTVTNTDVPKDMLPGACTAVASGCTCEQNQKPSKHRDGWGWSIDESCPLHSHWGELGE